MKLDLRGTAEVLELEKEVHRGSVPCGSVRSIRTRLYPLHCSYLVTSFQKNTTFASLRDSRIFGADRIDFNRLLPYRRFSAGALDRITACRRTEYGSF